MKGRMLREGKEMIKGELIDVEWKEGNGEGMTGGRLIREGEGGEGQGRKGEGGRNKGGEGRGGTSKRRMLLLPL